MSNQRSAILLIIKSTGIALLLYVLLQMLLALLTVRGSIPAEKLTAIQTFCAAAAIFPCCLYCEKHLSMNSVAVGILSAAVYVFCQVIIGLLVYEKMTPTELLLSRAMILISIGAVTGFMRTGKTKRKKRRRGLSFSK